MKNLFGFILFIFLCYWALRGCSGEHSRVSSSEVNDNAPSIETDTLHSCQDACGEGDIPIDEYRSYDDVSYAVFRVGDRIVGSLVISHETNCGQSTIIFNQNDFTESQLNTLLNEYNFVSSSPNCFKTVNPYDWNLPSFISIEMKYLRLGIKDKKVFVTEK
jgi:hypothetical protein